LAGLKNWLMAASRAATAYTSQIQSGERTASSRRSTTAREKSAATITRRRSQRSAKTPATEPSSTFGMVRAMNMPPEARAEPVRLYT